MKTFARLMILGVAVWGSVWAAKVIADDAPATATAPADGGTTVDLSKASTDFALTVQAPSGATAKDDFGDVDVLAGDGFQIVVHSSAKDIAAAKNDITGNTMNKLKQFITDTEDTLVYESEVAGQSEFHFLINAKVGDKTYGVEDNKGPRYTQEQVEAMVKSTKTLAAK
jgi:hypothetical protein